MSRVQPFDQLQSGSVPVVKIVSWIQKHISDQEQLILQLLSKLNEFEQMFQPHKRKEGIDDIVSKLSHDKKWIQLQELYPLHISSSSSNSKDVQSFNKIYLHRLYSIFKQQLIQEESWNDYIIQLDNKIAQLSSEKTLLESKIIELQKENQLLRKPNTQNSSSLSKSIVSISHSRKSNISDSDEESISPPKNKKIKHEKNRKLEKSKSNKNRK